MSLRRAVQVVAAKDTACNLGTVEQHVYIATDICRRLVVTQAATIGVAIDGATIEIDRGGLACIEHKLARGSAGIGIAQ